MDHDIASLAAAHEDPASLTTALDLLQDAQSQLAQAREELERVRRSAIQGGKDGET